MSNGKLSTVRVFVSYSHDSLEHRANILDLTQELRRAGLDAQIDQFVESAPPLSWPLWMNEQIDQERYSKPHVIEKKKSPRAASNASS